MVEADPSLRSRFRLAAQTPPKRLNLRLLFLLLLLLLVAVRQIAKENRPSVLRPGLRMYAYVANSGDGTVTVVDLVALQARKNISVGPSPSGIRAHPTREEIWGVSTGDGHVWVIDARSEQVVASIEVGAQPFAVDFSPDGGRAYVAASGSGAVVAIDCAQRKVVGRARAGRRPWLARVTPDGNLLVVPNRDDNTVTLLDANTLATLATIPVAPRPEQVIILPDSSKAFVSAAGGVSGPISGLRSGIGTPVESTGLRTPEWSPSDYAHRSQVSVVDLKRRVLLTNLPLLATANDLILKGDGGELFVPAPESHGLAILNTWTNEVAGQVLVGDAPSRGVLTSDDAKLYLSDSAAGHIMPIDVRLRRAGLSIPAGQRPGVCRLTPGEDLLLVVNEGSNDLAVIRTRPGNLITLVPVGSRPTDLAVKVF